MDEDNILSLTDEDIEKMGVYPPSSSASESEENNDADEESVDFSTSEEEEDETSPETDSDEEDDEDEESSEDETPEPTEGSEEESKDADADESEESDEEEETDKDTSDVDSEKAVAFYKALTSPIKANGKDYTIESEEEAKKLIQMGIGYTKRLEELKPARQLFKTFEQHKMLDDKSIGFAIDLVNGNKDAILKLIKDKGINPLDLDIDDNNEYKPTTGLVPEQSVEFDDIVSNLRDSEYYAATAQTIKAWDEPSRESVGKSPKIIADLHEHVSNGTYAKVSAMVDKQLALGNQSLQGLSDLERYNAVGNWMAQEGHLAPPSAGEESTSDLGEKVLPKAGKSNPKTVKKKKAAGIPRGKTSSAPNQALNPLDMDDSEFDKLLSKYS